MDSDQDSIWVSTLSGVERQLLEVIPQQAPLATPDLLVVGSGIVGLATAYFAAERGLRVQLVTDATRLGANAEYGVGCIIPNVSRWQFSPATQPLAQASRDWWAKLAVRPEFQIDWRVCGALMVDERRLEPHPRQHMLAALDEGYSVHDVDAEQVAILEPAFSPRPLGGLHYPSEAALHPLKAACGFVRGLLKRGGQITSIRSIATAEVAAGKLWQVVTSAGTIRPSRVFVDESGWSQKLLGNAAPSADAIEQTQQIFLATAPLPPLLKRPVLDTHWLAQLKSGEVVVAAPVAGSSQAAAESAVEQARELMPALRDVEFPRTWAGNSERHATGKPVIDRCADCENVWNCRGLDFGEVLFAPIIGKLLADWLQQGQRAEELAAFGST